MRLVDLTFQGLTRFEKPVRLDLAGMGRGLVALVGKNGEGKTTALEAALVALYKTMPSYPGSIYEQCPSGSASVIAGFRDDYARLDIEARVNLNAKRRTAESFLTVDGVPVTTGKGRDFDEEITRRFGSLSLVLASVFNPQNKAGNFLFMKPAERRVLFAELLVLQRYVAISAAAREKAQACARRAGEARAATAAMHFEAAELEQVRGRLEGIAETFELFEAAAATAREECTAAEAAWATIEQRAREGEAAAARVETTRKAATAAEQALVAAREQAAAEQQSIEQEIAALDLKTRVTPDVQELAGRDLAQLEAERDQLREGLARAELGAARLAELGRLLTARDAKAAAVVAKFDSQRAAIEASIATYRKMTGTLDQAPCVTGLADFADGRGTWLVPYSDEPHDLAGTCPLLSGGREALAEVERLERDRNDLGPALEAEVFLADNPAERAELEAERALLKDPEAAELRELIRESAPQAIREAEATIARVQAAKAEVAATGGHVAAKIAAESRLARTAASWVERTAEAANRFSAAVLEQTTAAEAFAALPAVDVEAARIRRLDASADVAKKDAALREVTTERATLTERLATLERAEEAAQRHRQVILEAEADEREWAMLDQGFGPKGVQALEIDAAGPTVSALANDLLSVCPDFSRYSLRFDTLREKQDGTKVEDFDVHVFVDGEERPVSKFSGGQKVILGEAIGLALAIFNAQRFGVRWETLFRDETAGALDAENAQAYVAMLRRAMEVGGFVNVLFVSHVPEVWEAADIAVQVEGGALRWAA